MKDTPVIDTCDHGHRFAKLADHPRRDGQARCPHCMAIRLQNISDEQERVKDRMMAAVIDLPEAHEGGYTQRMLRRAWERVRQARWS